MFEKIVIRILDVLQSQRWYQQTITRFIAIQIWTNIKHEEIVMLLLLLIYNIIMYYIILLCNNINILNFIKKKFL